MTILVCSSLLRSGEKELPKTFLGVLLFVKRSNSGVCRRSALGKRTQARLPSVTWITRFEQTSKRRSKAERILSERSSSRLEAFGKAFHLNQVSATNGQPSRTLDNLRRNQINLKATVLTPNDQSALPTRAGSSSETVSTLFIPSNGIRQYP